MTNVNPEFPQPNEASPKNQELSSHSLDHYQQQQVDLKLEVEQLYRDVAQLRGWLQTLVSGIVIALLIGIGISCWSVYRLLLEQQRARRDATQAATDQAAALQQVEQLQQEFESLNQKVPARVIELTDKVQVMQEEINLLRSQVDQVQTQQETLQIELQKIPKATSEQAVPTPEDQDAAEPSSANPENTTN
ncbi:MAG: hypothetical protein ACFBSC_20025 [Microcoleaceae cyanobacterium]